MTVSTTTPATTPTTPSVWQVATEDLEEASRLLDLDASTRETLRHFQRLLEVSVPIRRESGELAIFPGYRIVHSTARGPAQGGTCYHPDLTLEELQALAMRATWKASLLDLPLGGAAGGMVCDPETLSRCELEQLTRKYTLEIADWIGPDRDILGPDINTDSRTMAWIEDTWGSRSGIPAPGVAVGKPAPIGGTFAREEAPGRAGVLALRLALEQREQEIRGLRAAVHGFGSVGSCIAHILESLGAEIIAVGNSRGGVYNPTGLDLEDLAEHTEAGLAIADFSDGEPLSNTGILTLEADVLVLASRGVQIHDGIAEGIRAGVVLEAGTLQTTPGANRILEGLGITVVPDILAGAGSVAASYFERARAMGYDLRPAHEIRDHLEKMLARTYEEVCSVHREQGVSLRTAALLSAVRHTAEAVRARGLW